MGTFSSLLINKKLFTELGNSIGREGIEQHEVMNLKSMVLDVADSVGPLLERIAETFAQYTDHGIHHSMNIIGLIGRFVPPDTLAILNALELAILIQASLLHDIGMYVNKDDLEKEVQSEVFQKFLLEHMEADHGIHRSSSTNQNHLMDLANTVALSEFIRPIHSVRARQFIQEHFTGKLVFRQEHDLTDSVATLCESHSWGVRESIDSKYPDNAVVKLDVDKRIHSVPVNMQYLACCLRLADIMDFDRTRTPRIAFENTEFTEKKSSLE